MIWVRKVWVGPGNNYVEVLIRNLQGSDLRDNTGGSVLDAFGLILPNGQSSGNPTEPTPGSFGLVGVQGFGAPAGWGVYDGTYDYDGFFFFLEDRNDPSSGVGDGIRGCDAGPQRSLDQFGNALTTLETCSAHGNTGWGTISTVHPGAPTPPHDWDLSGASLTIDGYTHDNTPFRINFAADQAIVTPEPSSIVLLASGLALVGATGWFRSRRKPSGRPS